MTKLSQKIKGLWSMLVGMKVTGIEFFKPKLTIHYPRKEVDNLDSYRGHCDLVPIENDPYKPKCIMCGICIENCPSGCLTMQVKKNSKAVDDNLATGINELISNEGNIFTILTKKLPPTGQITRQLDYFRLDYNYCSLCGLCVQNCPVSSLGWSREAYLVGRKRQDFEFDLLERLRARAKAIIDNNGNSNA